MEMREERRADRWSLEGFREESGFFSNLQGKSWELFE